MSIRVRSRRPISAAVAAIALVALIATGCGSSSSDSTGTTSGTSGTTAVALSGSITVSAAASLTGTFTDLETSFQKAHTGTTVNLNFGSSAALVTQIQQGAPADVFASASKATMDTLVASGNVEGQPTVFARNQLELVVKPGNPLGIKSLADISKAKTISLCAETAPCGAAAKMAFAQDNITVPESQVTRGADVKATLSAVTNGDADVAVVYVTDARTVTASEGTSVSIPDSENVIATYEIAQVKGAKNTSVAQAWIAYVTGPAGQSVLKAAGFLPPTA
jgi:molybdate transport system substrate-binding protein